MKDNFTKSVYFKINTLGLIIPVICSVHYKYLQV